MLIESRKFIDFRVQMTDGGTGLLSDILFEDRDWKVRWLVVAIRSSLATRKVLIPPSVVKNVAVESRVIQLTLTTARIEGSPGILHDQPVSLQKELDLWKHFGMDPLSGYGGHLNKINATREREAFAVGGVRPTLLGNLDGVRKSVSQLRSVSAITGYHIHATDGAVGHIHQLLLDEDDWTVRNVVIDTRDWWFGKLVVLSPAVTVGINWHTKTVHLTATRADVRSSLGWKPKDMRDPVYEKKLQLH